MPIDSRTRAQIHEAVGRITGMAVVGTASANGDTASLIDTLGLAISGDDEYNNWNGMMTSGTAGNIGDKFNVTDFDGTNKDATISPVVSGATVSGDGYILWTPPITCNEVNALIRQAEMQAIKSVFIDKDDYSVFTQAYKYIYDIPSGFTHLDKIEYEYDDAYREEIDDCDTAWTAGDNVTVSLDDTINIEGTGCNKLVVAAGAAAGANLATRAISTTDLRNCTYVELWVYSTVDLTAGYLQLVLDDTALCASPVESLDIPATSANKWTRHVIALANPQSDSAIISVGVKMITDVGAFTLYIDQIDGVDLKTREFKELNYTQWDILRGSTDYLKITPIGLSVIGYPKMLWLNGYKALTPMSADSSTSEIDPDYIINYVASRLLIAHALPAGMDTKARFEKVSFFNNEARRLLTQASTNLRQGTRKI